MLLPPYGKECFFENLRKNDELSVSFQVGSRNPLNTEQYIIDFFVCKISCYFFNLFVGVLDLHLQNTNNAGRHS